MPDKFLDAIDNANNLYYVPIAVNQLKRNFYLPNGSKEKTIDTKTRDVQAGTMQYLKDVEGMAKTVADDLIKSLIDYAGANIGTDVTLEWTAELVKIVRTAISK
jgi:trimethylamine:corrinoid methyltransferase-like protein